MLSASGSRLRLKSEDHAVEGWVESDRVILIEEATEFFTNQLRVKPNDAFAFAMRAMVRHVNKEVDNATADFDAALKLDPQLGFAHFGRAIVWHNSRQYEKAIAEYSETIRLDPGDPRAFLDRGVSRLQIEKYDQAISDFTEAIRLEPLGIETRLFRARAWLLENEYDKAIADLNALVKRGVERADVYTCRGEAWREKNEYDKALDDFGKAIALDPKHVTRTSGEAPSGVNSARARAPSPITPKPSVSIRRAPAATSAEVSSSAKLVSRQRRSGILATPSAGTQKRPRRSTGEPWPTRNRKSSKRRLTTSTS